MKTERLGAFFDGRKIENKFGYPLSKLTGFRTGGAAMSVAAPKNVDELSASIAFLRDSDIPFFVVGKGTNLLALDEGYDGCVLLTENMASCEKLGKRIVAGAGLALAVLCKAALASSLTGLEFAFGIPGSVGGAVFMNAGAYGGEIKDCIVSATVLDFNNELKAVQRDELDFGYRSSCLQTSGDIVVSAEFELKKSEYSAISAQMTDILRRRVEKQPLELPSCGSTFKRPKGAYASALIEQCGLKGKSVGGAQVSEKHAGFIVNAGGATSADILSLIDLVQREVKEQTGFVLETEIKILR